MLKAERQNDLPEVSYQDGREEAQLPQAAQMDLPEMRLGAHAGAKEFAPN
jgi:hypothetical protein